jgi:hypothetical protein
MNQRSFSEAHKNFIIMDFGDFAKIMLRFIVIAL